MSNGGFFQELVPSTAEPLPVEGANNREPKVSQRDRHSFPIAASAYKARFTLYTPCGSRLDEALTAGQRLVHRVWHTLEF